MNGSIVGVIETQNGIDHISLRETLLLQGKFVGGAGEKGFEALGVGFFICLSIFCGIAQQGERNDLTVYDDADIKIV